MRAIPIFAVACLLLAACANNRSFRDPLARTGVAVEGLNKGTSQFIDSQSALNADNASRLDRLVADAELAETAAVRQEVAWLSAGNGRRHLTYSAATASTPAAIVKSLRAATTQHVRLSDGEARENYVGARDALVGLSRRPTAASILSGLLAYAGAVQQSYRELEEAAEASTNEAMAAAATTDGDD